MPNAYLFSPLQLAERLGQPNLVILDCRFALDDLAYGQRSYAVGHISGAQFADLEQDLSGPILPGVSGRHPLPDPAALIQRLRGWGVNQDSQVVLYDDGPGAYAAHAWWLLGWLGKNTQVHLLDGGLKAWRDAGLPLQTEQVRVVAGNFEGEADERRLIDAAELQGRLGDPQLTLLDARARPRFRGEVEPIDPVAGHIPGAQCAPFTDNLDADGFFLPAEQLRERFAALLGPRPVEQLVAYCGSGVTACHNLFALRLAGYDSPRLYPGSWSEWITDPNRPVARGD